MKKYNTKSLMLGYQIGLNNDNIYVAIPKKYFKETGVSVTCNGETKVFIESDKETETTLKDKYKPDSNYTLLYFKWYN
jgi:hypothetical protein